MKSGIIILLSIIISCGNPEQYRFTGNPETSGTSGIEIHLPSAAMETGETMQAQLLVLDPDGVKTPYSGDDIQWSSANPTVAEISESGFITAHSDGETEILAELDGFNAIHGIRVINPPDFSALVISEVFYDPAGPEAGKEFIEILNTGSFECDISGFRIIDGAVTSTAFVFPQGSLIQPGSRHVIAQSPTEFYYMFGFYPGFSPFSFALNNAGESVFLLYPDGTVRDAVYIEGGSAGFTAPPEWGSSTMPASNEGYSIHRMTGTDTDSWLDWESAAPNPGN